MAERDDPSQLVAREILVRTMGVVRMGRETAHAIAEAMNEVRFEAGDILYRRGDTPDHFYFVAEGEVELAAEGASSWVFRDRSVVGVLDVTQDRPRARTAIARGAVRALRIRADDWREILEENFDDARDAILGLASDLHRAVDDLTPDGGFPAPPEDALPPAAPLSLVDRILLLRGSPAFRRAKVQPLTSLASHAVELRFEPGEPVFERGAGAGWFLVVARGIVQADRTEPKITARFGPGDIVCGLGGIADAERDYDARAVTAASVLRIDDEDYFDVMEEHFDLARAMFASMAEERERLMNLRLARGLSPWPEIRVKEPARRG